MTALDCLYGDELRRETYEDCTAAYQHTIARLLGAMCGAEVNPPSFIELMHPELKTQDNRSGKEIAQAVLAKALKYAGREA